MALLVRSGMMDRRRVAEALRRTFERRGTHEIPRVLHPPPADWAVPFATMAEECDLNLDAVAAFSEVARSFEQLASLDE